MGTIEDWEEDNGGYHYVRPKKKRSRCGAGIGYGEAGSAKIG